jgi:hypothetical protein
MGGKGVICGSVPLDAKNFFRMTGKLTITFLNMLRVSSFRDNPKLN